MRRDIEMGERGRLGAREEGRVGGLVEWIDYCHHGRGDMKERIVGSLQVV